MDRVNMVKKKTVFIKICCYSAAVSATDFGIQLASLHRTLRYHDKSEMCMVYGRVLLI